VSMAVAPAVVMRCSSSLAESASSNIHPIVLIGTAWVGNMIWIKKAAAQFTATRPPVAMSGARARIGVA
jgi:hypothetical protein